MNQKSILATLLVSIYNKLWHQLKNHNYEITDVYLKSDTAHKHIADISRQIELMVSDMRKTIIASHNDLQAFGYTLQEIPLADAPDISVNVSEKSVRIVMDGILPFPIKGSVYFLHEKLDIALRHYSRDNALPQPLFDEPCAVVFIHRYDGNGRRQLRDYDNTERRCITNVIARHFLRDDSPACYIGMDILAPGKSNHTEIRLMTTPDFQKFVASKEIEF